MTGTDVNALNVYIETSESGVRSLLLSLQGKQGDDWRSSSISIVATRNWRVVIEGTTGTSGHGDIGLDDITFTPGCVLTHGATLPPALPTGSSSCPAGQFMCGAVCRSTDLICDFNFDCPNNVDEQGCLQSCDYEVGDLCYWTNQAVGNGANFSNHAPNGTAQPLVDHNPGRTTGHFALLTIPFNQYRLVNSRLVSPLFRSAGPFCKFSFWYMYNGFGISKIQVSIFLFL
jgi:hypothetical protein